MIAPLLVLAWGNASRGDDALGPAFLDRLDAEFRDARWWGEVEMQLVWQLQPEHALELDGRREVLFVDASATATPPFELRSVEARRDPSYTSHSMSPEALLLVYTQVTGHVPPPSRLLAIHGDRFELGEGLSVDARRNLELAVQHFVGTWSARPFPGSASNQGDPPTK